MGCFRIWSVSFTSPDCDRKWSSIKENLHGQHGRRAHQKRSFSILQNPNINIILITLRMSLEYFLESLTVAQLVKKFLALHEASSSVCLPTLLWYWTACWATWFQPIACFWWLYTNVLTHILNSVHRPIFFGPCFPSWFCFHQSTGKSRHVC